MAAVKGSAVSFLREPLEEAAACGRGQECQEQPAELVLARRAHHEAEARTWVCVALEARHCSKLGICSAFAFDFQDKPLEPEQTWPRLALSSPPALSLHLVGFIGSCSS